MTQLVQLLNATSLLAKSTRCPRAAADGSGHDSCLAAGDCMPRAGELLAAVACSWCWAGGEWYWPLCADSERSSGEDCGRVLADKLVSTTSWRHANDDPLTDRTGASTTDEEYLAITWHRRQYYLLLASVMSDYTWSTTYCTILLPWCEPGNRRLCTKSAIFCKILYFTI